ncbi:amidohydrolase family protein [Leptolyngbya sp. FACHB-261]|uniref:amidohydrolase family protein n=1 Tax=Leptolyngbya sp. FACHB-261 TaxID=2692806 RepID=UPI001684FB1D|nr:amidohydrolase family protein [Leptolyngbya sp. FACHB-261]MBD2099861.1 amidohydrolase family protein [Leptolyngbya sp. FACHB-261]
MQDLDLLLKQATLPNGSVTSVAVKAGRIIAIGAQPEEIGPATEVIDLEGNLLCPGFIDGHIHLDKTFLGAAWLPHVPGGSVRERIAAEKQVLAGLSVPVEARAARLIELALSCGSTALRTHVDIDPELGLRNLHSVLELRERYRDLIAIQIVAFPQSGVMSCPGTLDLLEAAIKEGADLVGGLDPAGIDGDIPGQLDAIFALAERYGVGIDIHLHDPDHLGIYQLEQIAQRTQSLGLEGRVAVSHAYALGMVPEPVMARTAELLARSRVAIMTNAPGSHAFPPILALRSAGVTVFAGSDNIRDAWWPFGDADMLERAMLIAYRSDFRTDAELAVAFELPTTAAAQVLGWSDYGLTVGARADLVVLEASCIAEAVVTRPARKLVLKQGRVVVRDGKLLLSPKP